MRLGLYYDLRNPGGARAWARVYAAALDRIGWADGAGTDVFCFGDIGGLDDDLVERHTELAVRELAPVLAGEGEL
jgi:hypothetical protein